MAFALALEHFFMLKKEKNNLIKLFLLVFLLSPIFVSADLSSAVNYLQNQGGDAWVTQALVVAGATTPSVEYLKSVSGTQTNDYAKTILALAATGKNPNTFGNIDYVAKLKTYYDGNQFGDANLLNDDLWAILALAAVGDKDTAEVASAKNYLIAKQNADGGWGYSLTSGSDTNDTAAAIMALIASGVSASDAAITKALSYLQTTQNADGGWGWVAGSPSDSGSDAWVIAALNKLGQNAATWKKGDNNPVAHLWSLQDSDGGFWWVAPGSSDFNNKAMTAYAVIALAGKSFPVGYFDASVLPVGSYHLRIEGASATICDTTATGETAMDLVKNAAATCNYSFNIKDSTLGSYLEKINDEIGSGNTGWLYLVNNLAPSVGASEYILIAGDEIVWYFGEWGAKPSRLKVNKNSLATGESLILTAEYYDGANWQPLVDATIKGGNQNFMTDNLGKKTITLADGIFTFSAEKAGYVRSNAQKVIVGSGIQQNVNLTVEVDQGVSVSGEAMIFTVTPNTIDFGKLKPGETKSRDVNLRNEGTVNLSVTAKTSGDSLFTDNLQLNSQSWSSFSSQLDNGQQTVVKSSLKIPDNYLHSGVKSGELIFWARAK
jgi:hypothetical protein